MIMIRALAYTYEDSKTDNIMDYTHLYNPEFTPRGLFEWQWYVINTKLTK